MSSRAIKAFRSIVFDGNFHRIWQILLKSPLVHVFAALHRLANHPVYASRKKLAQNLQLTQDQNQALRHLQEQGYVRIDNFFTSQDFTSLHAYLDKKNQELEAARSQQLVHTKDFWVRLSDSDLVQGMTTDHPLVSLSLKKEILEIVTGYLGSAPFLEYVLLTYSTPSKSPLKSSQLWHQDHDNDRMVKLFFYLSDVPEVADGPFTLLPKTANAKIKNAFFPRHLPDDQVEKYYPLSQKIEFKGPKFSAFLVDTSVCYHMGSRVAEGHSRLMSTTLFVTLPKAYWGKCKNFISPTRQVSELENAALDAGGG